MTTTRGAVLPPASPEYDAGRIGLFFGENEGEIDDGLFITLLDAMKALRGPKGKLFLAYITGAVNAAKGQPAPCAVAEPALVG